MTQPLLLSEQQPGMDSLGDASLIAEVHQGLDRMFLRLLMARKADASRRRAGLSHISNSYLRALFSAPLLPSWWLIAGEAVLKREAHFYSLDSITWEKLTTVWPSLPVGPRLWDLFDGPTTIPISPMSTSYGRDEYLSRLERKPLVNTLAVSGNQYKRLAEELTTMSKTENRQVAKVLIQEIRASGFTQLRKTNDGYLYGAGGQTFLVPYSVISGWSNIKYIDELTIKFREVRSRAIEAGHRTATPPPIEPTPNPDDLLATAEPSRSDVQTSALPSATPDPSPPATEMPTVSKKPDKRIFTAFKCPKCGKHLKQWGHHRYQCDPDSIGTRTRHGRVITSDTNAAKGGREAARKGRVSPEATHTHTHRSTTHYVPELGTIQAPTQKGISKAGDKAEVVATFREATNALIQYVADLQTAVEVYHRDAAEIAKLKQQLSAILGGETRVPRL